MLRHSDNPALFRNSTDMTKSGAIAVAAMSFFFYICGGLCVFKTKMLVGWAQRNYNKSKLVQAYPFSNMVTKPWYPAYIRGAGIFIWLWALAILVLFRGFH
jgi:hypothetical protein